MGTITIFSRFTPGTTPTNNPYNGSIAVVTTGTTVVFSTALPVGTNYRVDANCYNSVSGPVGYDVLNKTVNGFTVYPIEDATLEYSIFIW